MWTVRTSSHSGRRHNHSRVVAGSARIFKFFEHCGGDQDTLIHGGQQLIAADLNEIVERRCVGYDNDHG